jgi:hypothetical protein
MKGKFVIGFAMLAVFICGLNAKAEIDLEIIGPFYLDFTGSRPNIHMDRNGDMHLVYLSGNGPHVIYRKVLTGNWDEASVPALDETIPKDLDGSASSYQFGVPRVSATTDGRPAVVFAPRGSSAVGPIMYSLYDEGHWEEAKIATYGRPGAIGVGRPDITIDRNNEIYIISQETRPPDDVGIVHASFRHSTSWSPFEVISVGGDARGPHIEADDLGNLHCAWYRRSPPCVDWVYRKRNANGNWGDVHDPYYSGTCAAEVGVDADANGNPWVSTGGFSYIKGTGETWGYLDEIKLWTYQNNDWEIWDPPSGGHNEGNPFQITPDLAVTDSGCLIVWYTTQNTHPHNSDQEGHVQYYYTNGVEAEEFYLPGVFDPFCNDAEWCSPFITTSAIDNAAYVVYREGNNGFVMWKFKENSKPNILLGGFTQNTISPAGYEMGGPLNLLAIVEDKNGVGDLAAVQAWDPVTYEPLFNLYDDGQHGDLFAGDSIYGAILEDEFNLPGERQSLVILAADKDGAMSDAYPYLTIHGGQQGAFFNKNLKWEPTWQERYSQMMNAGNGDWHVYMAGYMDSNLVAQSNSTLDILAWIMPKNPWVMSQVDRVELLYQDIYQMELPLLLEDKDWGSFYGFSIPIPGDALPPETGGLSMEFQLRAVDSNGNPGPVWPYLEVPVPPTPTPTCTPTNTPTSTPTNTPTSTPTNTPTSTPTNTPTNTPTYTPTNTPTDTPTMTPTETPTDTPTETPTDTPTVTPTETPDFTSTPTPNLMPTP